jgi:hypothetical protein
MTSFGISDPEGLFGLFMVIIFVFSSTSSFSFSISGRKWFSRFRFRIRTSAPMDSGME